MRNTILSAALVAVLFTGCSKSDKPVALTPEMEAAQKEAQEAVNKAESAHQKTERAGKLTGTDQEALRAKQNKR
ncbi:hypothetical protein [Frigoriglobus tundricola]|uniref:Lipoprotein n=1 Tax=Frigoriglobus tundricola TaxID=2774151 RepID=A0A6M5YVD1_9BACT|nr:hypothetical protein [Frigoriglobus tundricola]QJW96872.1 hypothetical protein FTUN_4432 [Frigoriglobus tundricola]